MMTDNERRSNRSEDRMVALRLQLEACVERACIQAMVISDSEGFLVASTNRSDMDDEWLAAMLPMLADVDDPTATVLENTEAHDRSLMVRAFHFDGHTLFLGVIGRREGSTFSEMLLATRGVKRILSLRFFPGCRASFVGVRTGRSLGARLLVRTAAETHPWNLIRFVPA